MMFSGFKRFLLKGNVLDLAVAVVIGAAFGTVISAFVKDLLTPLIAAIGGKPDFSSLYFTVNGSRFLYGDFFNALISFVIIGAAIYFLVVAPISRLTSRSKATETPTTRPCPECLSAVPLQARKCAFCTSDIAPVTSLKSGTY
jgi:large conductance mechanosensitive channel